MNGWGKGYDDIPEWIKTVTPIETEDSREKIITELNYLKGSFIGHTMKGLENDEKLDLALKYQRELDAQFLEKMAYAHGIINENNIASILRSYAENIRKGMGT